MRAISRTCLLLAPYQRVAFAKRRPSGGINLNRGLLTDRERGDSFTEQQVYSSKKNVTAYVKSRRKERRLLREEAESQRMRDLAVDTQTEEALRSGRRIPLSRNEVSAVRSMDDEMAEGNQQGEEADFTRGTRDLLRHEVERRDHMLDKFGQAPTAKQFHKLFRQLRTATDDDELVEQHQLRLVEENGVYPSTRIDAFMLDNDTLFPDWVHALPYRVRDRVKYGSLGLTEEDEALRVRLGRMPRDRRLQEWRRLKGAKEYRAAHEETLTLTELRDARQGKRRFHWLQRKRQKQAAQLRRMALRKPEGYEEWPSSVVDYSQRVAFIAQHVANGVETNGQWPLDQQELLRAKIKRKQDQAERTFLMTAEEKRLTKKSSVNAGIGEVLSSFEKPEKPFKRLSRKTYANRVNAIVHGDQDEHGRRYRNMYGLSTRWLRPYDSMAEMALEREVRKEPSVNVSGLNHTHSENWTKHHTSWVDGMPSTRYGS